MALLKLAQVGCGGMGLRHAYGLIELQNNGFDTFELTAICDIQKSAAEKVASEIEAGCGNRPKIYTDFSNLLEEENPDAVDIVTDTRFHHIYAIQALENGANVTVEKPMALTVRACQKMINAAAALVIGGLAADLRAGVDLAREVIDNGVATEKLETLAEFSQTLE